MKKISVEAKVLFVLVVLMFTILITAQWVIAQRKNARLSIENSLLRNELSLQESAIGDLHDKIVESEKQQWALKSAHIETQRLMTSRGITGLSDRVRGSVDSEALTDIYRLELENRALRDFYKKTTGNAVSAIREVKINATMYTNAEGWWAKDDPNYGLMASGEFTYHGAVAAPRSIPFGATVMFSEDELPCDVSNRIFEVKDRGGMITEDNGVVCIDIWTDNLPDAYLLGRRYTTGYIIIPKESE